MQPYLFTPSQTVDGRIRGKVRTQRISLNNSKQRTAATIMALKGVKVLEFVGLAPGPFCGMVLANLGASVTVIEKTTPNTTYVLSNGKRSIAVDMKSASGIQIVKKLVQQSDVIIEPYRPGVMEKLGLGPDVLLKENPKLIYSRMTGFGQHGSLSKEAGHDINYVALTGMLSLFGRKNENPLPPLNILGDFAGGGFMCAFGILVALYERTKSGKGQVIDANMVEGVAYLSSFMYSLYKTPMWQEDREGNFLDGGLPNYETYKTKDGKYMSVGALEPHFYENFKRVLGISNDDLPRDTKAVKSKFAEIFAKETQEYWSKLFEGTDSCVAPVLTIEDAYKHPHNVEMKTFSLSPSGQIIPNPAPKFSRTPSIPTLNTPIPRHGEHTREILLELKYSEREISNLQKNGVVVLHPTSQL